MVDLWIKEVIHRLKTRVLDREYFFQKVRGCR